MPSRALRVASGSRVMTRRAAAAWMPMTDTWWATTSCSSRAMRRRSSVTARVRSSSVCAEMVSAWPASSARSRAERHCIWPMTTAPPKYTALMTRVRSTAPGIGASRP